MTIDTRVVFDSSSHWFMLVNDMCHSRCWILQVIMRDTPQLHVKTCIPAKSEVHVAFIVDRSPDEP